MADKNAVREHFKRLREENREVQLKKMQKTKRDEIESRELRLHVLGNGSSGSPTNVVLSCGHDTYLFNCGEGTQKLCMEYRVKMHKIANLLFTSSRWKNVGGLPGYLITAQGLGLADFRIHGAKGVGPLLATTQRFIKVDYLNVYHHESETYEDNVLRIQRVRLDSATAPEGQDSRNDVHAYICRCNDKPGRLLLTRCVERGVPVGPLFSQLKAGKEITLENGDVVKPSDVLEPPQPGPVVIILECPSEDYVDSLLASEAMAACQNVPGADENYHAACVAHMTPDEVYNSEKYQKFIKLFPETTNHLQLCESNTTHVSAAAIRRMTRLNLIHDEVFPMLPSSGSDRLPPMTSYQLRAKRMYEDEKHKISLEKFTEEAQESENYNEISNALKTRLKSLTPLDHREYPKVIFLGTGSSIPTKDRNVSGILVRASEDSAFLLDCGESTINQIFLAFGPEKAEEILAQLKFIYISHIHADHHLGVAGILWRRKALGITDELTVFAPSFLPPFVKQLSRDFEQMHSVHVDNRDLLKACTLSKEDLAKLGVTNIATCYVDHCPESYGVRVEMGDYSLVYSGDTLPSDNLVQLGKDCDLLIHEATMEDELLNDAKFKSHSTTTQAKEVAKRMNAKFTLLTHFSQRYAKLPYLDDNFLAEGRIGLAFDFMHVCPRNLHILPHIYPMLKCVYNDHFELLHNQNQKYVGRKQQIFAQ